MKINLARLEDGLNEIEAELDIETLGLTDDEDVNERFTEPIYLKIMIDKIRSQFFMKVKMTTTSHLVCDCCLDNFTKKVNDTFKIIISTEEKYNADYSSDKDFRVLPSGVNEIDITDDIRESLLLTIPMQIKCADDCKGLCSRCGANLNHEQCDCDTEEIDPRWEVLKKLK